MPVERRSFLDRSICGGLRVTMTTRRHLCCGAAALPAFCGPGSARAQATGLDRVARRRRHSPAVSLGRRVTLLSESAS